MNRETFLQNLGAALSGLTRLEREEILTDYQSYFDDAVADGQSEEIVAAKLGDPQKLAKELVAQRRLGAWEERKSPANLGHVFAATARLGLLNLALAVPTLLSMAMLTALAVAGSALALTGLLLCLLGISQGWFNWPAPNQIIFNTSGIGPVLIDGASHTPEVHVKGTANNESFSIEHQSDGGIVVRATEGSESFVMEKNPDGSIKSMRATDGDKEVQLSNLKLQSPLTLFVLGCVLLLVGVCTLWLTGRWLKKLLAWLRNYLDRQLQMVRA
jgi:uncharacterized membrane protein